jgi:hypothetical protein
MSQQPTRLSPDDLAQPTRVRHRPIVDTGDISPEELAERQSFQHRLRALQACAERVRTLTGSEQARALQAETRASLERIWRRNAPMRASTRGVPARDDVRRMALMPRPPSGSAMDAVASFLRWRANRSAKANGRSVPGVLVLLSRAGSGKSSAGGWAVTWHRHDALYTTASHVAANPLVHHSEARNAWSALRAPDLLVIDEVGREPADKGPSPLTALCMERDALGHATILMGNRTTLEFLERYVQTDEAMGSRLQQQRMRGMDPVVSFAGPDLRMESM